MVLCNGKHAGRHRFVEGLKRNRQWEDSDPVSVVLESVIIPSRCLTCDQLSSLGASCPMACACRFGRARRSDKTQTDFTPLRNVSCMYCRSWRMRHGKLVLCKCLTYLRNKFLEKGDTAWRYQHQWHTKFKLFVTYALFYRPCYNLHALGHEAHPECCCQAAFPFLPSTRRLMDGLDFVLLNLSSFDVSDMRDMTDESCDEGNVCSIYLSSFSTIAKKHFSGEDE